MRHRVGFYRRGLCGADKLARVGHLAHDPAVAEVLGLRGCPVDTVTFLRPLWPQGGRVPFPAASLGAGGAAPLRRGLPARSGFVFFAP